MGIDPDSVNTERFQIVQLFNNTANIANAIIIGVFK